MRFPRINLSMKGGDSLIPRLLAGGNRYHENNQRNNAPPSKEGAWWSYRGFGRY